MDGVKTKLMPCKCSHKAQDIMYGKGKRVHNYCDKDGRWRCTVCGDDKS